MAASPRRSTPPRSLPTSSSRPAPNTCRRRFDARPIGSAQPRTYEIEADLHIDDLTKIYSTRDGPVRALDHVSIDERPGEFLSILGPSGCGKSTLMMIAAGLVAPSSGSVSVAGKRVDRPRTDI